MSCEHFEHRYDLYALGSLQEPEAGELAEHLRTGCPHCHAEIRQALDRTRLISSSVPLVEPPARLRSRIHRSVAPEEAKRTQFWPWLIATAACLTLLAGAVLQYRWAITDRRTAPPAAAESMRDSQVLAILGTPGTVELPLRDPQNPKLAATLYVHKKLGMVMVVTQLPEPPKGWVYESWLMPKNGAPLPVESFDADTHGRALSIMNGPVEIDSFMAMAISLEPRGARPVKPTTMIFKARV